MSAYRDASALEAAEAAYYASVRDEVLAYARRDIAQKRCDRILVEASKCDDSDDLEEGAVALMCAREQLRKAETAVVEAMQRTSSSWKAYSETKRSAA